MSKIKKQKLELYGTGDLKPEPQAQCQCHFLLEVPKLVQPILRTPTFTCHRDTRGGVSAHESRLIPKASGSDLQWLSVSGQFFSLGPWKGLSSPI